MHMLYVSSDHITQHLMVIDSVIDECGGSGSSMMLFSRQYVGIQRYVWLPWLSRTRRNELSLLGSAYLLRCCSHERNNSSFLQLFWLQELEPSFAEQKNHWWDITFSCIHTKITVVVLSLSSNVAASILFWQWGVTIFPVSWMVVIPFSSIL